MKASRMLAFIGALALVSCASPKPVVIENTTVVTEVITERDTVFTVKPDSTYYNAYIECVNGKPIVINPTPSNPSGKLKPPKVVLDDSGNLSVNCETEVLELKAKLRDKEKLIQKEVQIPIMVPAEISSWQHFQIWLGRILALFLLAVLIGYVIKNKTRW
jgi:hypothetical protein